MAVLKFDKRLKSILAKQAVLAEDVLGEALARAETGGKSLTQVLLEDRLATEEGLLGALSQETHLPPINVFKVQSDESLAALLPQNLATYYGVIPVSKVGGIITLAVSNPFDILQLDDIQIVTGCSIRPVLSTDVSIRKAIPEVYNKGQQMVQDLLDTMGDGDVEVKEAPKELEDFDNFGDDSNQAPVVKLVNVIIYQAIQQKASDIHIEPMDRQIRVRYRVDGTLRESLSPPKKMQNAIASRIKIISGLDIAEKRKPQDGKFQIKVDNRKIDFRVSVLPTIHGEKVVLRILDSSNLTLNLESLGFEEKALLDIRHAIGQPYGMLLVTGPTGSGKSTTLYSCVREVLSTEDNIVTVEDPVEYQLEGVNQVQVSLKRGLTFAAALRSILRQDPDTILLGEIRDQETVEIAVKAALTGHLVFSTLHTNDAPSTITRMVDMGVDPFLVASSVCCVAAQRLAKKLCEECRKPMDFRPPEDHLLRIGFKPEDLEGLVLQQPQGCPRCEGKGYKGRFAVLETLPLNDDIRRIIIKGGSALDIKAEAMKQGMISLRRCGLLNVMRGRTSLEEVLKVTVGD
ncbi:MAG: Flp pilus assembly complex ATPase component TadA [Planctomycetes bacterium]|nr:Flp pilus assembly complex ATPase component TadA [Planctomycetota bacterium]